MVRRQRALVYYLTTESIYVARNSMLASTGTPGATAAELFRRRRLFAHS